MLPSILRSLPAILCIVAMAAVAQPNPCERGLGAVELILPGSYGSAFFFADLNGDGRTDIVESDGWGYVVYLNRGAAYEALAQVQFANQFYLAALHDQTGDGRVDLIAGSLGLVVQPGNGDGTFGPAAGAPFNAGDIASKLVDFDDDGLLDYLALSRRTASVFAGQRDGRFASPVVYDFGREIPSSGILFDDFDGDGDTDIFYGEPRVDGTSIVGFILLGPAGTSTLVQQQLPVRLEKFRSGDLEGDGPAEVLSPSPNGTFARIGYRDAGISVASMQFDGILPNSTGFLGAADVTADGIRDLVFQGDRLVQIVPGVPGSGWGSAETFDIGSRSAIELTDFDDDGYTDLVARAGDALRVVRGGALQEAPRITAKALDMPERVIPLDANRDDHIDLLVFGPASLNLFLADGRGTFTPSWSKTWSLTDAGWSFAATDYDDDGRTDVATHVDGAVRLLRGASSSFVQTSVTLPFSRVIGAGRLSGRNAFVGIAANAVVAAASGTSSTIYTLKEGESATVVNLDADDELELLVSDQYGVSFLLNRTGGTWSRSELPWLGIGPFEAVSADVNADGASDAVLFGSGNGWILLGSNTGTSRTATILGEFEETVISSNVQSAAIADFDGDAMADVIVFLETKVQILKNLGGGTFRFIGQYNSGSGEGAGTLVDADEDGWLDAAIPGHDGVALIRNVCAPPRVAVAAVDPTVSPNEPARLVVNFRSSGHFEGGKVTILRNGQSVFEGFPNGPYLSWTSEPLARGAHTFEVVWASQEGGSSSSSVTVYAGSQSRRRSVRK